MCGRSSLTKTEKEIEARFNATFYTDELARYNPLPNYNVAPTQFHPVITQSDPRHIQLFNWGLVPSWSKNAKMAFNMINARVETLTEKPTFKEAVAMERCLVPIDGFYEWARRGKQKTPYRIIPTNTDIVALAGLYAEWIAPDNSVLNTFTIITQAPNDTVAAIHDRMPAMLMPDQEWLWLDSSLSPYEALQLITPYPDKYTRVYPVSNRVNSVANNDKSLIEPVELPPVVEQLSLF